MAPTAENVVVEDEVQKIRTEFEDAKRNFFKIPEAVSKLSQTMKMNPEGL